MIIGPDDRKRSPYEAYPYSSICHLEISRQNGIREYGTGWFIADHAVLTAAHNIYIRGNGWASSIRVAPGRNGPALTYYDTVYPSNYRFVQDWVSSQDDQLDYALLMVKPQLGRAYRPFALKAWPDSVLASATFECSGYPLTGYMFTQWYARGRLRAVQNADLLHEIDTSEGQSGAPIFYIDTSTKWAVAVGIHTGHEPNSINRARRINADLVDWISGLTKV